MKTYAHIIIILLLSIQPLLSQQRDLSKAVKKYKQTAFINTAEALLKVAEKGYESKDLFQKLGDSFYFNRKMEDAVVWYAKLMELDRNDLDPEYYFRYAQALKTKKDYTGSDVWMNKFLEVSEAESRRQKFVEGAKYISNIDNKLPSFQELTNLNLNSAQSDFGATLIDNQLVFASSRGEGPLYSWNNQPYLDLYIAQNPEANQENNVKPWSAGFNTPYHESSVAFSPDGQFVYFTRNNYAHGTPKKDRKGISRLQLLSSSLDNTGHWSKPVLANFTSSDYSTAHPTLSPQGDLMIFSSDMPESIGQADLFIVSIDKDGSFGSPKNLGKEINTGASESFPFINKEGDLFFSSDGYPGLGGLDVYVIKDFLVKYKSNQLSFKDVNNLGSPVNSPFDDFAFMEYEYGKKGYVSSNRPGGKGDDDIYSFGIDKKCLIHVEGVITNKSTGEKIPYADVSLLNHEGDLIKKAQADENAQFSFGKLECIDSFLIKAEKEAFEIDEKRLIADAQELSVKMTLSPIKPPFNIGDDLATLFEINNINFDFDKANIRYDAEKELQKVLEVLLANPTMKISIKSHTDCKGSVSYNSTLSEKRAVATRNYLIEKGIAPERMTAKGYGESEPIQSCNSCNSCTDYQHQANRRSEFIIVNL